jgi:hypothetical protein
MVQFKDLSKNALWLGVKSPAVMQSLFSQTAPTIGFFDTVNPVLIISSTKQKQRYLWDSKRKNSGCNSALHERQISLECDNKTVVIDCRVANPSEESFS